MYDIIVVGSGLSSSAFLKGFGETNKKIGLISPSTFKIQKKTVSKKLHKYLYKNLPPRFNKNNINSCINYFLKNKIKIGENLSIFGDLSHGGVSKYWGGSCEFPFENEISFLNKKNKKKLINSYVKIFNENKFYGDLIFSKNFKNKKNENKDQSQLFKKLISMKKKNNVKFFKNVNAKNTKTGHLFLPTNIKKLPKNIKILDYFVKEIKKKR